MVWGLPEGEEIKLQYVCYREVIGTDWAGNPRKSSHKGLLVFTNDNLIFMQQEGAWSSSYSQALRIPLEYVSGITSGGFLVKHVVITTSLEGATRNEFYNFKRVLDQSMTIEEVRQEIEQLIKKVRVEKKHLAQEALAKGTIPQMIFCKYCGVRNKSDSSFCANCKATLT